MAYYLPNVLHLLLIDSLQLTTSIIGLQAGTVNRGSNSVSSGLIVNDWQAFCGYNTTGTEMNVIEGIFKLADKPSNMAATALRDALIDR